MAQERIGSYRVLEKLGAGGMGVVYRAEHVAMGQRAVVKKLWPQYGQNPQILARFFQEARIAAAIDDPGIVRIFDYGTLRDGSSYIVMEHLSGETVAERLRREGAIEVDLALALARQAARIIGAAHARGVVHRDLKPENLFLVPDPEVAIGLRVKVLDFGIAKLLDAVGADLTSSGSVLGTPPYMPPEQWRNAARVDARADVYALGCILFEMVCGKRPFPGPGQLEYMDQHRFQQPPDLGALVRGVPEELGEVIRRALAKSADDRFATMDELAAALARVGWSGTGLAVARTFPAPPPPAPSNSRSTRMEARTPEIPRLRRVNTLRRVANAIAAACALAAAAYGIRAYGLRRMAEERRASSAARAVAEGDAAFEAHDYGRAAKAYEVARAAGAPTPRRSRAELESSAQRAWEELEEAIARNDFDAARRSLEGNEARGGLYYAGKAEERAAVVNAGYVRAHVLAARAQSANADGCAREAQLALAVEPANADATAALAGCANKAATSASAEREAKARRLLDEGNALVAEARDYESAAAKYLSVLDLKPGRKYTAWAYRGLGTAYTYGGKSKEAARYYRLYLPLAPDDATRKQVQALIERLDR